MKEEICLLCNVGKTATAVSILNIFNTNYTNETALQKYHKPLIKHKTKTQPTVQSFKTKL